MSERVERRFDMSIAAGGLASGALGLGTALLLDDSVSAEGAGPTAASLSDAFTLLFGAAMCASRRRVGAARLAAGTIDASERPPATRR